MKIAFSALWASIVRTIVPLAVGGVLSWVVSLGIPVDPEFEGALTALLTLVLGGLYHLIVRVLEVHVSPRFGWLLGLAQQPVVYAKPDATGTPVITELEETGSGVVLAIESSPRHART